MKTIYIWVTILLIIIFITFLLYTKGKKEKKIDINGVSPVLGTIERKILISGTIVPYKEVQVKALISGIIDELYIKVGDKIQKGDKICKIRPVSDPISYERLIRQYNINLSNFQSKKVLYERKKELYTQKVIAQPEYEDAENEFKIARHELNSIEKELKIVNGGVSSTYNIITSTTDGTVLDLPLKEGAAVMARSSYHEGTTVASISNLDSLLFHGQVLESDINFLHLSSEFSIKIGALRDTRLIAKLFLISPKGSIVDGNVKFDVWANLIVPNTFNEIIRAGYSATAEVILERKSNVLTIDEKYINFENDSSFALEINPVTGNLSKVCVQIGISNGQTIEIINGISKNSKLEIP